MNKIEDARIQLMFFDIKNYTDKVSELWLLMDDS